MRMGCDLIYGQRDLFCAARLCENKAIALMNRKPTLKVRKPKSRLPVAAIGRADQLEQRFVLANREELPLAKHPSRWGEVAGKHTDFSNVRWCHCALLLVRRRENAL